MLGAGSCQTLVSGSPAGGGGGRPEMGVCEAWCEDKRSEERERGRGMAFFLWDMSVRDDGRWQVRGGV